jgi:hypothetical protein
MGCVQFEHQCQKETQSNNMFFDLNQAYTKLIKFRATYCVIRRKS